MICRVGKSLINHVRISGPPRERGTHTPPPERLHHRLWVSCLHHITSCCGAHGTTELDDRNVALHCRPEAGPVLRAQRCPKLASANRSLCSRGCERQYCLGACTLAPSFAAACQGQRGS